MSVTPERLARRDKRSGAEVVCQLCPRACRIPPNHAGDCRVRINVKGRLVASTYGRPCALHVDPIEKKPLFHVLPGSRILSLATVGCNLKCRHCQNSEISQMPSDQGRIEGREFTPRQAVSAALKAGCSSISYTYTEPTVYFEYACDTAQEAAEVGLKNVVVTNGYIRPEPLREIRPFLHGANVDLKSFRESFYRKICKAHLQPVLDTLQLMVSLGIWVEVTTLLIPGLNDEEQELRDIAGFIAGLGREVPWHVSAFHPTYRMTDRSRTSGTSLRHARDIGMEEGLHFVYTGNIPGNKGENTYCPRCGACVIGRYGFQVTSQDWEQGKCKDCGQEIPIIST